MRRVRSTLSAVVVALRDCAFRRRAACLKAGENHRKPWPSPPDAPRWELPVDVEATDDDAAEERAPVAAPARTAAVRVVGWSPSPRWVRSGSCWPTPSESFTLSLPCGAVAGRRVRVVVVGRTDRPSISPVWSAPKSGLVYLPPFLSFRTCLRRPSVAVSTPPFIARLSTNPGIGIDRSMVMANVTLVFSGSVSPNGVMV
jgi:hypothetical protein